MLLNSKFNGGKTRIISIKKYQKRVSRKYIKTTTNKFFFIKFVKTCKDHKKYRHVKIKLVKDIRDHKHY